MADRTKKTENVKGKTKEQTTWNEKVSNAEIEKVAGGLYDGSTGNE